MSVSTFLHSVSVLLPVLFVMALGSARAAQENSTGSSLTGSLNWYSSTHCPRCCQSCRAVRPGGKSKWVSDLRGDWPKRNAAQLHKPDLPEILSGLASQITPVIE